MLIPFIKTTPGALKPLFSAHSCIWDKHDVITAVFPTPGLPQTCNAPVLQFFMQLCKKLSMFVCSRSRQGRFFGTRDGWRSDIAAPRTHGAMFDDKDDSDDGELSEMSGPLDVIREGDVFICLRLK